MDPWVYTSVQRTGTNTDFATLKSGRDVAPDVGVFFIGKWLRPARITSMSSCDDGGVVTHSLAYIRDGIEYWECNDDSYKPSDFAEMWPRVVVFPHDWMFREADYQEDLCAEYAVIIQGGK